MANQQDAERLKHSIQEWNQWRQEHPQIQPDLSFANLERVNLSNANLFRADLTGANLTETDLTGVHLLKADLTRAHLTGANLERANLFWAILSEADLSGTHFTSTRFWHTFFVQIDLSNAKGLETAIHEGPSTVNMNSVILPHDEPTRTHFLRGVGFTETQIDYLPSLLTSRPIQYHSLFISYANQDEAIAQRLFTDFRAKNVPCWFAPHDLKPGDYFRKEIDKAIYVQEKLLLILSKDSVGSRWVKYEVNRALNREIEQERKILYPIRLDNTVLNSTSGWAADLRAYRHIGNFIGWQDDAAYQQAFEKLLRDLKANKPPETRLAV